MKDDIKRWMRNNIDRFVDECGEVNCTLMVETWDIERSTGGATLDTNHIAWVCGSEVADEYEST